MLQCLKSIKTKFPRQIGFRPVFVSIIGRNLTPHNTQSANQPFNGLKSEEIHIMGDRNWLPSPLQHSTNKQCHKISHRHWKLCLLVKGGKAYTQHTCACTSYPFLSYYVKQKFCLPPCLPAATECSSFYLYKPTVPCGLQMFAQL